jgi:hypothetical protein
MVKIRPNRDFPRARVDDKPSAAKDQQSALQDDRNVLSREGPSDKPAAEETQYQLALAKALAAVDWDAVIPKMIKFAQRHYSGTPGTTPTELVADSVAGLYLAERKTWKLGDIKDLYRVLMGTVRSKASHAFEHATKQVSFDGDEHSAAGPAVSRRPSRRRASQEQEQIWRKAPCPCCTRCELDAETRTCRSCQIAIPPGQSPDSFHRYVRAGVGRRTTVRQPDAVLHKIELDELYEIVLWNLASDPLVQRVLALRLDGFEPAEIAFAVGKPVADINNADKRLRRRVHQILNSVRDQDRTILADQLADILQEEEEE